MKNVLTIALLKIAINRTSPKGLRERVQEEWQAHLDALPDGTKLRAAVGFLRSTFYQENEKLRTSLFIFCMAICSMMLMHVSGKIDFLHMITACGIILGIFGTAVLWWEPVATNHDLDYINDEITYLGNSTKLSRSEMYSIVFFAVLAVMQACAASYLVVQKLAERNPHGSLALAVGSLCIVYACAPFGMYILSKMGRRQCARWLERLERLRVFKEEARYAELKRIVRRVAFAIMCLAGAAQLSTTLL